jgi:hypothetical protein
MYTLKAYNPITGELCITMTKVEDQQAVELIKDSHLFYRLETEEMNIDHLRDKSRWANVSPYTQRNDLKHCTTKGAKQTQRHGKERGIVALIFLLSAVVMTYILVGGI